MCLFSYQHRIIRHNISISSLFRKLLLFVFHKLNAVVVGVFLSPSHDYTTFENNPSTFTFNCSGNGIFLLWTVNGYTTGTSYVLNRGIQYTPFIVSPDGLTVSSQLIVPTTKANNNITVICTVQDSLVNQSSDTFSSRYTYMYIHACS